MDQTLNNSISKVSKAWIIYVQGYNETENLYLQLISSSVIHICMGVHPEVAVPLPASLRETMKEQFQHVFIPVK